MKELKKIISETVKPIQQSIESWQIEISDDQSELVLIVNGKGGKSGRKKIDLCILESLRKDESTRSELNKQIGVFLQFFIVA